MARCELTGKKPVVKNLVSHSNIKTKSTAQPNVQKRRMFSRVLNDFISLNVAASTIRSIEHSGGFDKFMLNADEEVLSPKALDVKNRLRRRLRTTKKTQEVKP